MKCKILNKFFFLILLTINIVLNVDIKQVEKEENNLNSNLVHQDSSLIEFIQSENKNIEPEIEIEELLEKIFISENDYENSLSSNDISALKKYLDSKDEEKEISNLKMYNNNQDENSFIFLNEKINQVDLIKEFCFDEKDKIKKKISFVENNIYEMQLENKQKSNEKISFENKIKENVDTLLIKTEEIKKEKEKIETINNDSNYKKRNTTEIIIILDSLIHLVNIYYDNIENNKFEKDEITANSNMFSQSFLQLVKKTESLKDYSLVTLFNQILYKKILSNDNNYKNIGLYKGEIKKKILETLEKIKIDYQKKDLDYAKNFDDDISLINKEIDNKYKFVELLNEENIKFKNLLSNTEKLLLNNENNIELFKETLNKLNEILFDIKKICI